MNKLLIFYLMTISFISCKQIEKQETIEEFVLFSYSGYQLKDSLNNFYSGDNVSSIMFTTKLKYDSIHFDIRQYFEYKKDNYVRMADRKFMKSTEFYKLVESDTIGLNKLINITLLNKKFETEYLIDLTLDSMYEGRFFYIYYKTTLGNEFIIHYIPLELPFYLSPLHEFIEKLFKNNNRQFTNDFEYHPITIKLAINTFTKYPPPPLPSLKER